MFGTWTHVIRVMIKWPVYGYILCIWNKFESPSIFQSGFRMLNATDDLKFLGTNTHICSLRNDAVSLLSQRMQQQRYVHRPTSRLPPVIFARSSRSFKPGTPVYRLMSTLQRYGQGVDIEGDTLYTTKRIILMNVMNKYCIFCGTWL